MIGKKLKADSTKKIFFDFFMLRRYESVFKGKKKNFSKIFFWKFLVSLTANIKAAPPPAVITIPEKVPRDIFLCNVEKFELLA